MPRIGNFDSLPKEEKLPYLCDICPKKDFLPLCKSECEVVYEILKRKGEKS